MHRLLLASALLALLPATAAIAGGGGPPSTVPPTSTPGQFSLLFGLDFEFGDTSSHPNVGLTAKALFAPFSNPLVIGGGGTYFPWSTQKFGLDLSGGLKLGGLAALGGYDFLTRKPQVSVGIAPGTTVLTCPADYFLDGDICDLDVSDRRQKRDIIHIATLSDGMRLYAFRYLWSETVYVGVIAQDLLDDPRWRHAVAMGEDGFYRVDYNEIDLVMVTLETWNQYGLDAMVLRDRPAEFLAEQAA